MNGTLLHSLLPDLLSLFLWENASDHKLLSVSGFTERKRLTKKKKKNLNWHHWMDYFFVFVLTLSEFGTPRTCKKKKEENNGLKNHLDLMTNDRLDAPPRDSRRAVFRNVCGLCVLEQCGLASRTCAVASWVRGIEKKKWFIK